MKRYLLLALWAMFFGSVPCLAGNPAITALAFSSDGSTAGAGDGAGGLSLWSSSGQRLKSFPGHSDRVHGVALRGNRLISWARDATVIVTDLSNGKQLRWKAPEGMHISSGEVNPQGTRLATRTDRHFLLWDLGTGKATLLDARGNPVRRGFRFSEDGKWLAAGVDRSVVLFDGSSGQRLRKISLNVDFVDQCFTPEGTLLTLDAICVREWQPSDAKMLKKFNAPTDPTDLRLSSDGRAFMVLAYRNSFETWIYPNRRSSDEMVELKTRLVGFGQGARMIEVPSAGSGYAKILSQDGSPERKFSITNDDVLDFLYIPDTVVIGPGARTLGIAGYGGSPKFYPLGQKK